MNFLVYTLSTLILITIAQCQKTGEEIADELYKHPNECKDPSDGGIWAPLAPGHSCGPPGHDCKYPDEWCSARSSSKSVPLFSCVKLPEDCKRAVTGAKSESTAATSKSSTVKPSTTKSLSKSSSTTIPKSTTEKPTTLKVASTSAGPIDAASAEEKSSTQAEKTEPTTEPAQTTESSAEEATTLRTKRPKGPKGPAKPRVVRPQPSVAATVQPPADDCKDGHPLCCYWASNIHPQGTECDRNALWMRTTCQKSCGTCGCQASNFQSCAVVVNTDGCEFLPGGSANRLTVPVNQGGGVFVFPTAGGNQGPIAVPVGGAGTGFQGQGGFPSGGPSPVVVPVGNVNGAVQPINFGNANSPVIRLRAGRR